ncbi:LuxR family transcriptional regulator [Shinella sp. NM-101]|uniref:LuxR family transcriptional regulator n=1 Tax=Shinella sp. NM-101 TaxID=2744455 RepID=UPI001F3C0A0C|nr:LuxR family transcriptional regulator [Shinella sp. NM-101]
MKINLLVQFLALIDELRGRDETTAEFERLLALYGFDYYGLIKALRPVEGPENLLLAGHWPVGWPETYLRKRYMHVDPTVRYLGYAQAGFRWRDTLGAFRASPHRKRMERMMVDARHNGLEDGYMFPVHGRRGLIGSLSLGGRPVDLEGVEVALFEGIARRLYWKLVQAADPDTAARLSAVVDVELTRREMEALSLLAEGMTSHDIGRVLGISSHTVDWYMNGIQEKLGARNRHHAIAIAFRLGLVS